ncbi:MAG: response regulator [Gammaproteobacteria bacterium]
MSRIVVIEDNPNNMELITIILKHHGHEPFPAFSGISGLEEIERVQPDFVLLDIQLPDIDGYEVLNRIRARSQHAKLPVIALTSYAMAGDRQKLLVAGCNGYIEKPINPETIVEQIENVVRSCK